MNVVFLSPHFPPQYHLFCKALKEKGVNVLGIGDADFFSLPPQVQDSLTYYYFTDMNQYENLLRAGGFFTYKYGKLDKVESLNEHWLEMEARLREDFNISGVKTSDLGMYRNKSEMKKVFRKLGLRVAKGKKITTLKELETFIAEVDYPVIVKPDVGVGANSTYRLNSPSDLQSFWNEKRLPGVTYFAEEFIEGDIESFDGLVNEAGEIIFYTSHKYCDNVMDLVLKQLHTMYYSVREVPEDLKSAGFKLIDLFKIKGKFFHFEFFRTKKEGELVPLELNLRPPGGLTVDMFNYACDIDIFQKWAEVILGENAHFDYERKYFCAYIGRRDHYRYLHSLDEILSNFQDKLVFHTPINSVFREAIGDYGFIVRVKKEEELFEIRDFIHATV